MKKRVEIQGIKTLYRQKGQGEPIILLHGWEKSGQVFTAIQKNLPEYQTFAPDLPGFGQTPLPPFAWGVKDYARFVIALSQKLKLDRFSLIGHSFGGRIALEIAAFHPQLVDKLILTGVPVLRKAKPKRAFFWLLAKTANLIFSLPPLFLLKKPLRKLFYLVLNENDYQQTQGLKREIFKKTITHRQEKILEKIKAPTLILWGENDRFTSFENGRLLNQKISRSQLEIIPQASHKLPYQKPIEFSQKIIQFLKE